MNSYFRWLLPVVSGWIILGWSWFPVGIVFAQGVYVCQDASGKTLTSDRPMVECQTKDQRVLSKDGTTVKRIRPEETEDELEEKAKKTEQKKKEDRARQELVRQDRALLNTYTSLEDLESKRQRALVQVIKEVKDSEKRYLALQKELEQVLAEERAIPKGKPVPPDLRRRRDQIEAAADGEKRVMKSKDGEIVQINQKFERDKERYTELISKDKKR